MSDKSRDQLHDDEPESAEEPVLEAETEPFREADEASGIPTRKSEPPPVEVDSGEPMPGQTLARRYVLEKRLGSGGMGIVYRANDMRLGKLVALKVVRAHVLAGRGALERFYNEVKFAQDITDRGVCRVFDVGEDGPLRFFTMELVEGKTLRQLMRIKPLAVETAYGLLVQVAKGLIKVHEQGIVHRDLKPDNVMVRADGTTVLMDFGLARHISPEHSTTTSALGTPSYMSPEQLRNEHLDARSDIFSFGVMVFELMTGRLPFEGISRDERVRFFTTEWGVDVAAAMESFFVCALAKSRDDRFASSAEMLNAFEHARAGITITLLKREEAKSDPPVGKTSPVIAVKRFSPGTVALVALLIGVLVTPIFYPRQTEIASANKLDWIILERDVSTHFDWRPVVEVHAFKNSTGEAQWNSLAESVPDAFRSHLRTNPKLRVSEGESKPTWIVDGAVQIVGDNLRLSVEVLDTNGTSPVPPIEVDGALTETAKVLKNAREILLDDLRRLVRFGEMDRKAMVGTKNEEARQHLQKYLELVGTNRRPKKEDYDLGKKLLDTAIALDPEYVSALVERAYLQALGVGHSNRSAGVEAGLNDLQRALTISPNDPDVLVMRCRLLRQNVEIGDQASDSKINAAMNACDAALKAEPTSAQVRLAFGRLHDRMCEENLAIESLETALQLDHSLAGTIYVHLMALAMQPGRMPMAERYSDEFVQFVENNRHRTREDAGAYLMRGSVLLRLSDENPARLTDARIAFEHEVTRAHSRVGATWMEAAAIRGLMRVAKAQRSTVPESYLQRLRAIEADAEHRFKSEPSIASAIASSYGWSDPDAALKWAARLGPPTSFADAWWRALLLHQTGNRIEAQRMLARWNGRERWELNCQAWARRLIH